MNLTLLYRGVLASCNYDCHYCPFAKRKDSRETLARDAADLQRFTSWLQAQPDIDFNLLFTPWGEALTRRHYREAITTLSHLPNIRRVAVQTNLSTPTSWLQACQPDKVSLWCTFHPGETSRSRFLRRIAELRALGVHHSVGMVAKREFFAEINALRMALPADTYLWLNAYHDEGPHYYPPGDADWLTGIDPWFSFNLQPARSLGAPCQAGKSALSIDGDGNIKRCHFIDRHYGNLYDDNWRQILHPPPAAMPPATAISAICNATSCHSSSTLAMACRDGCLHTSIGIAVRLAHDNHPHQAACYPDRA